MENIKKIEGFISKLSNYTAILSFVGLVILMILNVLDVIMSKLTGNAILGAYEISEIILMVTVFASFAYGQTERAHVKMTLIIEKFPERLKFIPYFLGCLLTTISVAAMTIATFSQAGRKLTSNSVTGILYIPYYPFYYISGVCMIIFLITLIYELVISFLAIFKKEYGDLLQAQW